MFYRFESCHTGTASASRSFTRSPLGAIKESKGSGLSPKSNGRSLLAEFFLTVFIHNIMDIKFYANVIEMRKWQKEYFQTRSRRALDQAKHFEREVDKQLASAYFCGNAKCTAFLD